MSAHDSPVEIEPRTPVWLTVLGACLFLALAVYWLAPRPPEADATIRIAATAQDPGVAGAEAAPPAQPSEPPAPTAPAAPSGE